MNCVVAIFYGFVIWIAMLSYVAIVGGNWVLILCLAPVIISGVTAFILLVDTVVWLVKEGWKAIG